MSSSLKSLFILIIMPFKGNGCSNIYLSPKPGKEEPRDAPPPHKSLHAKWISAFPKSPAYSWSFRSVSPARMVTSFLPAGLLAQGDWSDWNSCWAPPTEVSLFGNQEIYTHKSLSCELQGLESYISQVA